MDRSEGEKRHVCISETMPVTLILGLQSGAVDKSTVRKKAIHQLDKFRRFGLRTYDSVFVYRKLRVVSSTCQHFTRQGK